MRHTLGALLLAAAAGCTTVDSVTVSQIPAKSQRTNVVKAHSWSPIILLVPFGSGYIDDARSDLLAQCKGGSIQGLLAEYDNTNYFLGLYMTQSVTFKGYCVNRGAK